MAITATATILTSAADLPDGYTPPTLTPIVPAEDGTYIVDLNVSGIADPAVPATGVGNLLTAVETDFVSVQAVDRKIDATATVTVNLTIRAVQRVNDQGTADGNLFITGTEVYRCTVDYEWN